MYAVLPRSVMIKSIGSISASFGLRVTQPQIKKHSSGGEQLAKLCSIRPARDLNLRISFPESNAFPIDQLPADGFSQQQSLQTNSVTAYQTQTIAKV